MFSIFISYTEIIYSNEHEKVNWFKKLSKMTQYIQSSLFIDSINISGTKDTKRINCAFLFRWLDFYDWENVLFST